MQHYIDKLIAEERKALLRVSDSEDLKKISLFSKIRAEPSQERTKPVFRAPKTSRCLPKRFNFEQVPLEL